MYFTIKRDVIGNVFQSRFKFKAFGNDVMDATREKTIIDSLEPIVFTHAGVYEDHMRFDKPSRRVVYDPVGSLVRTMVAPRNFTLNQDLDVLITRNAGNISKDELNTHIITKRHAAEARILLEERAMVEALEIVLGEALGHETNYKDGSRIIIVSVIEED